MKAMLLCDTYNTCFEFQGYLYSGPRVIAKSLEEAKQKIEDAGLSQIIYENQLCKLDVYGPIKFEFYTYEFN